MALTILQNDGFRMVLHVNANQTIIVAGNNTISNLISGGLSNTSEVVTGASISRVWYGCGPEASAYWVIGRGNSTVNSIAGVYAGTNEAKYNDGAMLNITPTGDIYATLVGSANGYLMIELKKQHG